MGAIHRPQKNHGNRKCASWLLGLGRVRDDRLIGWLPLKDLDVKGEATVVRMLCEAHNPGSLLHTDASSCHHVQDSVFLLEHRTRIRGDLNLQSDVNC